MANVWLARHFSTIKTAPTHAIVTASHQPTDCHMTYTIHQTEIPIKYGTAPTCHTTSHHFHENLNNLTNSAVYQLTNETVTTNLSKSHVPFLWCGVFFSSPSSTCYSLTRTWGVGGGMESSININAERMLTARRRWSCLLY